VLAIVGTGLVAVGSQLSDRPHLQMAWVIFVVFLLKVPLIWLLWWFISRNREWPGRRVVWDRQETAEILAYLQQEAETAQHRPDATARLAYLAREAWNVADNSSGDLKVDALTTALRIEQLSPGEPQRRRQG
jgi:hypothetical protein